MNPLPPEMAQFGLTTGFDLSLIETAVLGIAILAGVILMMAILALITLPLFLGAVLLIEIGLRLGENLPGVLGKWVKLGGLVFRSLRRNLLRTSLTYVALFVLTGMLTLIYSVVAFLSDVTAEKEDNVKVIMTEKYQAPSQMPPGYTNQLIAIMETKLDPELRPKNVRDDVMTWSFVGGSLDLANRSQENSMFAFCMEPHSLLTMMDGLGPQDMPAADYQEFKETVVALERDKRNLVLGKEILKKFNKQVGDEIKLFSTNYKDIEFEFKIVGQFPEGRYDTSAVMRLDYLTAKLDDYKTKKNIDHPQAQRCANLIWVKLPNRQSYEQLAALVGDSGNFNGPAVKMETASSGLASILDSFKDILWGMKYGVMPAVVVIMCLVVGITITISVRERRPEMAVLKVLGFQPNHVMLMVLGEAMLIGVLGGLISTWSISALVYSTGGIKFPIAFFNTYFTPLSILWMGPLLGVVVGFIGAIIPASTARKIKVSEVFSKVA